MTKVRRTKVTKSSGNVFADLSIPNPEDHLLKAELVRRIAMAMKERDLSQTATAELWVLLSPTCPRC
jgi:hypothetical protein